MSTDKFNFDRIENGVRSSEMKDCVFLWLYARGCKPYAKYMEVEDQNQEMPMAMMQLRWDGSFGVAGGKVDEGETLEQALHREIKEEIAYEIKGTPVPMATFKDKSSPWHIHSYSLEVSFEELIKARNESVNAEHRISECSGYVVIHMANYKNGLGLEKFKENQFCATALREFEILEKEVLKLK